MPYISYPVIGAEHNLSYNVCGIGIDFCRNNIYHSQGFCFPQFVNIGCTPSEYNKSHFCKQAVNTYGLSVNLQT